MDKTATEVDAAAAGGVLAACIRQQGGQSGWHFPRTCGTASKSRRELRHRWQSGAQKKARDVQQQGAFAGASSFIITSAPPPSMPARLQQQTRQAAAAAAARSSGRRSRERMRRGRSLRMRGRLKRWGVRGEGRSWQGCGAGVACATAASAGCPRQLRAALALRELPLCGHPNAAARCCTTYDPCHYQLSFCARFDTLRRATTITSGPRPAAPLCALWCAAASCTSRTPVGGGSDGRRLGGV